MRKLLLVFLALLLICPNVEAAKKGIFTTVASGTVTQANMKLSGVDGGATASGGAFVDWGYKYQSNFSAGVNGWSATRGTAVGNIDSIGGEDNVLRFTIDTTAANTHYLAKDFAFVVGKKYTVTFKYYIPSGQTVISAIYLSDIQWGTAETYTVLDTWTTITKTFIATGISPRIQASNGTTVTITDPGGDDVFYIKDVTIVENPPDKYIGHLLRIKDSAGKQIQGFIKAAMGGETLDTEVATGTLTALKLYKITATEVNHFGTGKVVGSYFTSAGTETCDANNKVQQVLVGATTGVTIVSTKGGSTYNWTNKNSAFNWNDTSGYTYEIVKVNSTTLMASNTCTNANATLTQTDGSASWVCTGIDDSAYQDGKHIIHISDAAGLVIFGYYKSGGSGAVVNAKSGSTQNFIYKKSDFATDGDYTRKIYYVGD